LHLDLRQVVLGFTDRMSACARSMLAIARCTVALAPASWACNSAVSSRATTAPLWTKSPSFTRISATRPGSLAAMSTRSTSIRPLAAASPSGVRAVIA
jgi:hypothetical protein